MKDLIQRTATRSGGAQFGRPQFIQEVHNFEDQNQEVYNFEDQNQEAHYLKDHNLKRFTILRTRRCTHNLEDHNLEVHNY